VGGAGMGGTGSGSPSAAGWSELCIERHDSKRSAALRRSTIECLPTADGFAAGPRVCRPDSASRPD
jgi:hypothetical protein